MWFEEQRRRLRVAVLLAAVLTAAGCAAHRSVVWQQPPTVSTATGSCPVFVMEPAIEPRALHGNIGRNAPVVQSIVAERIVEAVRERCPDAEIVRGGSTVPVADLRGYGTAAGRLAPVELPAAAFARQHGARYLLVPTIALWREARTDDPIGAFVSPHSGADIELRLMRLDAPALAGRVTFRNRSRVTLNQPADRLLDEAFRDVVRQIVSGTRG